MYDDPRLGLQWPLPVTVISDKDQKFRSLDEIEPELKRRMRAGRGKPLTLEMAKSAQG